MYSFILGDGHPACAGGSWVLYFATNLSNVVLGHDIAQGLHSACHSAVATHALHETVKIHVGKNVWVA